MDMGAGSIYQVQIGSLERRIASLKETNSDQSKTIFSLNVLLDNYKLWLKKAENELRQLKEKKA